MREIDAAATRWVQQAPARATHPITMADARPGLTTFPDPGHLLQWRWAGIVKTKETLVAAQAILPLDNALVWLALCEQKRRSERDGKDGDDLMTIMSRYAHRQNLVLTSPWGQILLTDCSALRLQEIPEEHEATDSIQVGDGRGKIRRAMVEILAKDIRLVDGTHPPQSSDEKLS